LAFPEAPWRSFLKTIEPGAFNEILNPGPPHGRVAYVDEGTKDETD
jgi:hypothetical protein